MRLADAGFVLDSDRPDTSTDAPAESGTNQEFFEIVNVQRRITARVTFTQWGDTGQQVEVVSGLRAFLGNVTSVINELAPYLGQ
jgi:hypothetical protein